MTPKISVVMPVYNSDKYLRSAIESILGQSFVDFEFIIINDGSTDACSIIINEYKLLDSRVRLVERENKGLIYSLNQGIGLATSEYIARMDADDICHKDRLSIQYDYITKHPDLIAVGTLCNLIDSDGDLISIFNTYLEHHEIDSQHLKGLGGAIIHPSALIRKDALVKVGMYNHDYAHAEDIDLWLRLAEVGKLANINTVLFNYRQHAESIGHTKRGVQIQNTKKAVMMAHKRRKLKHEELLLNNKQLFPTIFDTHLKWAWWAFMANNMQVSRKHALKALFLKPWSLQSVKIIVLTFIRK